MGEPSSVLGQTVGQYRIASFLGAGGMAEVFIGEHAQIGRQVAIKVLMSELCTQPQVVERFMNEARALGRITHPNVVEIFDVGQLEGGRICIVMELLRGEPLSRLLARRGRLPVGEAVDLASQIADAMAAAHERKIIHRDLKPDNVFVVPDESGGGGQRVKVLDFGVAKLLDGAGAVATATKTALGTASYMAPEQFRSSRLVDHRADIYALGCLLFELLTGAPPYPQRNLAQQMLAHATEPIPVAAAANPEVPARLDAVLHQMLAKSPDERFSSMTAVRGALAAAMAGEGQAPAPVPGYKLDTGMLQVQPPPPGARAETEVLASPRRGPGWLGMALAVLIAIGIGVAIALAVAR
jgi:eukaryotic-like serine/threonine-protein kinase